MFNQTSESSNFYTNVITKEAVDVIIQTTTHLMRGKIYIRPEERVKEDLNNSEKFIAVTDIKIYNNQQEILYQCNFLALNRDQIVWILPENECTDKEERKSNHE